MPVLRFEPHQIPRLGALGDGHGRVRREHEFRAGFLEPFINRGVFILKVQPTDDAVLNAEAANFLRRILEEKRLHAPRAVGFPHRNIQVVVRAHETDRLQIVRKVIANSRQRVGAAAIHLVNFQCAPQLRLVRMEDGQPTIQFRELCRFVPLVPEDGQPKA